MFRPPWLAIMSGRAVAILPPALCCCPKGARWMVLPLKECPAAPAQGALAIECRRDDMKTREILAKIHHPATAAQVGAERQLLADWGGVERVDREAAQWEASRLLDFQAHQPDTRVNSGFYFGTKAEQLVLHASPVSTGFAVQALAWFDQYSKGCESVDWRMLI